MVGVVVVVVVVVFIIIMIIIREPLVYVSHPFLTKMTRFVSSGEVEQIEKPPS